MTVSGALRSTLTSAMPVVVGGSLTGFTVTVNDVSTNSPPVSVARTVSIAEPFWLRAYLSVRVPAAALIGVPANKAGLVLPVIVYVSAGPGSSMSLKAAKRLMIVSGASSSTVTLAMPFVVGAWLT